MAVVLRNGLEVPDPLAVVEGFLGAYRIDPGAPTEPLSFAETDLRRANSDGARISAAQIAAILERRGAIEGALRAIAPDASLAAAAAVPWPALGALFDAFADIAGVGFAKMTKALHPKRPALIPILDSLVQAHLADDLVKEAPFGERALGLVRGYKRDLDANRAPLRALQRQLARHGHELTEVRILDVLIWSVEAARRPSSPR
jgi:Family of unknown function (DUF6308)